MSTNSAKDTMHGKPINDSDRQLEQTEDHSSHRTLYSQNTTALSGDSHSIMYSTDISESEKNGTVAHMVVKPNAANSWTSQGPSVYRNSVAGLTSSVNQEHFQAPPAYRNERPSSWLPSYPVRPYGWRPRFPPYYAGGMYQPPYPYLPPSGTVPNHSMEMYAPYNEPNSMYRNHLMRNMTNTNLIGCGAKNCVRLAYANRLSFMHTTQNTFVEQREINHTYTPHMTPPTVPCVEQHDINHNHMPDKDYVLHQPNTPQCVENTFVEELQKNNKDTTLDTSISSKVTFASEQEMNQINTQGKSQDAQYKYVEEWPRVHNLAQGRSIASHVSAQDKIAEERTSQLTKQNTIAKKGRGSIGLYGKPLASPTIESNITEVHDEYHEHVSSPEYVELSDSEIEEQAISHEITDSEKVIVINEHVIVEQVDIEPQQIVCTKQSETTRCETGHDEQTVSPEQNENGPYKTDNANNHDLINDIEEVRYDPYTSKTVEDPPAFVPQHITHSSQTYFVQEVQKEDSLSDTEKVYYEKEDAGGDAEEVYYEKEDAGGDFIVPIARLEEVTTDTRTSHERLCDITSRLKEHVSKKRKNDEPRDSLGNSDTKEMSFDDKECSEYSGKLEIGSKVYAKHKRKRYRLGEIRSINDKMFCEVDFDEGTYSNDMLPRDILNYNIKKDGSPESGAPIDIWYTDGQVHAGTFRGINYVRQYLVKFKDGSQATRTGDEVFPVGEDIPVEVLNAHKSKMALRAREKEEQGPKEKKTRVNQASKLNLQKKIKRRYPYGRPPVGLPGDSPSHRPPGECSKQSESAPSTSTAHDSHPPSISHSDMSCSASPNNSPDTNEAQNSSIAQTSGLSCSISSTDCPKDTETGNSPAALTSLNDKKNEIIKTPSLADTNSPSFSTSQNDHPKNIDVDNTNVMPTSFLSSYVQPDMHENMEVENTVMTSHNNSSSSDLCTNNAKTVDSVNLIETECRENEKLDIALTSELDNSDEHVSLPMAADINIKIESDESSKFRVNNTRECDLESKSKCDDSVKSELPKLRVRSSRRKSTINCDLPDTKPDNEPPTNCNSVLSKKPVNDKSKGKSLKRKRKSVDDNLGESLEIKVDECPPESVDIKVEPCCPDKDTPKRPSKLRKMKSETDISDSSVVSDRVSRSGKTKSSTSSTCSKAKQETSACAKSSKKISGETSTEAVKTKPRTSSETKSVKTKSEASSSTKSSKRILEASVSTKSVKPKSESCSSSKSAKEISVNFETSSSSKLDKTKSRESSTKASKMKMVTKLDKSEKMKPGTSSATKSPKTQTQAKTTKTKSEKSVSQSSKVKSLTVSSSMFKSSKAKVDGNSSTKSAKPKSEANIKSEANLPSKSAKSKMQANSSSKFAKVKDEVTSSSKSAKAKPAANISLKSAKSKAGVSSSFKTKPGPKCSKTKTKQSNNNISTVSEVEKQKSSSKSVKKQDSSATKKDKNIGKPNIDNSNKDSSSIDTANRGKDANPKSVTKSAAKVSEKREPPPGSIVEVDVQGRRKFTMDMKYDAVVEWLATGNQLKTAKTFGIDPKQIRNWSKKDEILKRLSVSQKKKMDKLRRSSAHFCPPQGKTGKQNSLSKTSLEVVEMDTTEESIEGDSEEDVDRLPPALTIGQVFIKKEK